MQGNRLLSVIAAGGILLTAAVDVCGENQWRTVKGGDRETIDFQNTFDTLYQLTALAASKWKFDGSFEITSGYNGWIKDSDTEELKSTKAVGALLFSASAFPVKIAGKIVPTEEGSGPPPPTDWSVQGNPKVGTPGISPATVAIAAGEQATFQYLLDGEPPASGLEISWKYPGTDWRKSGSTFTFPPVVPFNPVRYPIEARISDDLGTASAEAWYVAVKSLTDGDVVSTKSDPGIDETLVVIKDSGPFQFTAVPDPENAPAWPDGYPVWSPENTAGSNTYTFTPSEAGEFLVKANCGTSSIAIKVIVIDIVSITRSRSWVSCQSSSKEYNIADEYTKNILTVKTKPEGYEHLVILNLEYENMGTLERDKDYPEKWTYIAPLEYKYDLTPVGLMHNSEHEGAKSLTCQVFASISEMETDKKASFILYSVFGCLSSRIDKDKAWKYARWKYDISTSDLNEIAYDASESEFGMTHTTEISNYKKLSLGPLAFDSEWLCASILGHENIHGGQDWKMIILLGVACEIPAYQWELDHSNAVGCSGAKTYIYDFARLYYANTKVKYAKFGGPETYP